MRQSVDENDPANQRSAHTEGKVKRICAYKKENFHYAVSPCVVCSAPHPPFFIIRARSNGEKACRQSRGEKERAPLLSLIHQSQECIIPHTADNGVILS